MIIDIAFICDDGFALPTGVALASLAANRGFGTEYRVHILSNGLSDVSKNRMLSLASRDVKIDIRDVDGSEFAVITSSNVHVSNTAIFKFKLAELFPALDRILYLDGDIVVRADLTELWNTELDDNYVAAVEDRLAYNYGGKTLQERIGYPHEKYFNSGMMLINLAAWRRDGIGEKLMQYRLNGKNDFMDQDALNSVLGARTVWLDTKYNTTATNFRYQPAAVRSVAESAAVIYHYASPEKPWKIEDADNESAWLVQFERSPFADVKLERRPRTAMEVLRRRSNQLSHDLRDQTDMVDSQRTNISELRGALATVKRDRREILQTVESFRERAVILENANKELDAALRESKQKVSELRGALDKVKGDRQTATSSVEVYKARVETLSGAHEKLGAALQSAYQEMDAVRGEKVRLEQKMQQQMSELSERLDAEKAALSKAHDTIRTMEEANRALAARETELKGNLAARVAEIEDARRRLDVQTKTSEAKIAALEGDVAERQRREVRLWALRDQANAARDKALADFEEMRRRYEECLAAERAKLDALAKSRAYRFGMAMAWPVRLFTR